MRTSYVFLAEGFEEIEAIATVDVLRRAGLPVQTVSITPLHNVRGAHGIEVVADTRLEDIIPTEGEWLICPGGLPGASNLAECTALTDALKSHKRGIAAICAAPAVVLAPLGLLDGKDATCYPGFEDACRMGGANILQGKAVVAVQDLVTSAGPATAVPFALTIVAATLGEAAAAEVAKGMLVNIH